MNKDKLDMSEYQIRTDLVVESKEIAYASLEEENNSGIVTKKKKISSIDIETTRITEKNAEEMGKKSGLYTTIYAQGVIEQDTDLQIKTEIALKSILEDFLSELKITKKMSCLVVGLGNNNITPDAIGPLTVENLLVTNHLFELEPDMVKVGFRPVCALVPGVMGTTGMETSDLVQGVVHKVKPDFMIVVDALAARSVSRVNSTIQITDTGIHPGSGVGNRRKEISKETMGIPVISIGVPTVVDAATITSDAIDLLLKNLGREFKEIDRKFKALVPDGSKFGNNKPPTEEHLPTEEQRNVFLGLIGNLEESEKRQLIQEVLTPLGQNLIVTPKEVDKAVEDIGNIISNALNDALHGAINEKNAASYSR